MGRDERWRRLFFEAAEDLGTEPLRDEGLAGGIFGTPAETRQELDELTEAGRAAAAAPEAPATAAEQPAAAETPATEATPPVERPATGTGAAETLEAAETAVAAGTATAAQRKLAGKYDTVEQLEQGYSHAEQRMGSAIAAQRAAEAELAAYRVAAQREAAAAAAAAPVSPWGHQDPVDTEGLVELALKDPTAAWEFVKRTPGVSAEERQAVENHYAKNQPAAYQQELTQAALAHAQQQQLTREAPRVAREQKAHAELAAARLTQTIPDFEAYKGRMATHIAADPTFFADGAVYDDPDALTDRMRDLYFWLKGQDVLADVTRGATPGTAAADTPSLDPQAVKDAGAVITTGSHTGTAAAKPGQGPSDEAYKSTIFSSEP